MTTGSLLKVKFSFGNDGFRERYYTTKIKKRDNQERIPQELTVMESIQPI